jgi:lysophospholipase L1-like esterase
MSDSIRERDLGQVTPAPTDLVRIVRGGQSVMGPAGNLPVPVAAQQQIDTLRASQGSGLPGYETFADLPAAGNEGQMAMVTNDPTPENNGAWRDDGAEWVLSEDRTTALDARVTTNEQTLEPIAAAIDSNIDADLIAFTDSADQLVGRVKANAAWAILLDEIANADGLEVFEYESIGYPQEFLVVDANLQITGGVSSDDIAGAVQAEVIEARGSRLDLDTRLSQSITPYGMPSRHTWGEWFLRETRQRLRLRLLSEAGQLVVASIGDSWTHNSGRWSGPTASTMKTAYGDAGAGYVSFARINPSLPNGNVANNSAVTYTGTWDYSVYYTAYSADLGQASSSTATDRLSYTIAGTPSAVKLHAKGGAGVVRYRFNGGSWTSVDLSALSSALHVVNLTSPVAGVFDVEVVSGTPVLFGIDVQSATSGVRWHKLGATGSRAQQWAAVDATNWKAGLAALAPNLVTILHGTNDQASYDAATYKTHMQTLITRVKEALPLADILLVAPCENGSASAATRPMAAYASALYELAATNGCAYLNLQHVFGDEFSEYASTSPRAWFNADNIHPEPTTGGRTIVDAVMRLLTTQ